LACDAQVEEFCEPDADICEVTAEPLQHHRVIRDLIVDRDAHFQKLIAARAVFAAGKQLDEVPDQAMVQVLQTTRCIHCGLCVSACEAYPDRADFVGPAALAWTARFLHDPRDDATLARRLLAGSAAGTPGCVDCGQCNEVCPEHVAPFEAIKWLRSTISQ
jgi:succinate dehydrogenase/fumarate reductase iron-sulfur protein